MSLDPIDEFRLWLSAASAYAGAPLFDPTAMTLATAGRDGRVSARMVLLKDFGVEGFIFYSNYTSRKAAQLQENPWAALLLHWPHLQRQVRIEGIVTRISRAESERYFRSRPRESQIAAAISDQSQVIPNRKFLEDRFEALKAAVGAGPVPFPQTWGGYRLVPETMEFWEHRDNRLHDRIRYSRKESGDWLRERLAP